MNWQYVDIGEVYTIHQLIIARAKTKAAVRDFTLLHSAVERPRATYSGCDLYPTAYFKAAALLQSLCLNHPFTDGNKRTAWTTTHRFLWKNNYHLKAKTKEAVNFMVEVDTKKPTVEFIAAWLKKRSGKLIRQSVRRRNKP
ncbi:type II toxin-antitoxin system death-on-curing family toxin [Microgenomates group bacterium]|nr:type II toxin-antitoxin system death-on-curing family toxin [Microgenomates group bacterium]